MMKIKIVIILVAIVLNFYAAHAFAQDAVPGEILSRTRLIAFGNGAGTAFSVDYKGRLYLITARHVVEGMPSGKTKIEIWDKGNWSDYEIVKTIYPESSDVDIVILKTKEKIAQPYFISMYGQQDIHEGPTFGQPLWFLGYPFADPALISHFSEQQITLPFIKKGTLSAMDTSNEKANVVYIDGFNNPGFSGGPVVYWDFNVHAYRILAVVQGYRNQLADAVVDGKKVESNILINSGILKAYSIRHVLDAIKADAEN